MSAEGRRGLHRHATLSISAYGFLMTDRRKAGNSASSKKTSHKTKCLPFPGMTSLRAVQHARRHMADPITTLHLRLSVPYSIRSIASQKFEVQYWIVLRWMDTRCQKLAG